MSDDADVARVGLQRELTRQALDAVASLGFVLAGSGAIREHGLTSRRTEDIDLFTVETDPGRFGEAVQAVLARLSEAGHDVVLTREHEQFARLAVHTAGTVIDIDLGVDWRRDDPALLAIGPVLSLDDAVGNKVAAIFSRGEARDYLDVDAIRRSRRFSDARLLAAVAERDGGFDRMLLPSGSLTWSGSGLARSRRTACRPRSSRRSSGVCWFGASSCDARRAGRELNMRRRQGSAGTQERTVISAAEQV